MQLKYIREVLVQEKYLEALANLAQEFSAEPQVTSLIEQAQVLLNGQSRAPFSELIAMNEQQLRSQLETCKAEFQPLYVEAWDLERKEILKRLLSQKPKDNIKALAIIRSLEQVLDV